MRILGIDTSCDETSAAVVQGNEVLSNVVLSQDIHKIWGGVVPILAKRSHQAHIDRVIDSALRQSGLSAGDMDAIGVTVGPGLAIALEVGIRKALEISEKHDIPVVPVNHIEAHIYSIDLKVGGKYPNSFGGWKFPALAVVLSGGHTEMHLMEDHGKYKLIGRTRDDAIGELFDKIGREMGLGYPAGMEMDALGSMGNDSFDLPVPMKNSWDFSYSGLKTAALIELRKMERTEENMRNFCRSLEEAAFESVMIKLRRVIEEFSPRMISVSGGVSANSLLRNKIAELPIPAYMPDMRFTGDNAAMVARAALMRIHIGYGKDYDRKPRWRLEEV